MVRHPRLPVRRHFVEPVDGALLGADAAAQHQVLVQALPLQARSGRELSLLESAVGVEQVGALGAQHGDLGAHRVDVAVSGAANLDRDVAGAVVGPELAPRGSAIQRASSARRVGDG